MILDPGILELLESLAHESWTGHAWRHVFGRVNPLHANSLGARWNPKGVLALYTSLSRKGALAEGDHLISRQPVPPSKPRYLYKIGVNLGKVIDLGTLAKLAPVGIDESDLAADDFDDCPMVGGCVAWLERDGLIVPSARSDAKNLVIFTQNLEVGSELHVVSKEPITEDG